MKKKPKLKKNSLVENYTLYEKKTSIDFFCKLSFQPVVFFSYGGKFSPLQSGNLITSL
jgi:hypothetical protein